MEQHEIYLGIECTLFFEENPYTFDSLEGIAYRLGRKQEHLKPILNRLVMQAILVRVGEGNQAIYQYVQPEINLRMDVTWSNS
jgi:hypothetical protein